VADAEKKRLASWIGRRIAHAYPDARCSLDYANPLELYVATVLSAQCTDVRVNLVTPELFRDCRTPEDFLALGPEELERKIQSTGFFRNKARSILGGCARLIEAFGGEMPRTMEKLLTLPGVGRKTANVILGNAFGKQEGVVVDTHVGRVTARLGLTAQKDPVKVERDLMELFPRKDWTVLSHRLILHGRGVCSARAPRCGACILAERCAFAAKSEKGVVTPGARRAPSGARAATAAKATTAAKEGSRGRRTETRREAPPRRPRGSSSPRPR
jgi:endonuclease III